MAQLQRRYVVVKDITNQLTGQLMASMGTQIETMLDLETGMINTDDWMLNDSLVGTHLEQFPGKHPGILAMEDLGFTEDEPGVWNDGSVWIRREGDEWAIYTEGSVEDHQYHQQDAMGRLTNAGLVAMATL